MKYYLWLLPSGDEAIALQQIITDLCRGYSQPSFPAHITVWSGRTEARHIIPLIEQMSDSLPITVFCDPVTVGQSFFHCVYLPVQRNKLLQDIHQQIIKHTGKEYPFNPHISLLYGDHSPARRNDISQNLVLPFNRLNLGHFALVQGDEDSKNWKIVYRSASNDYAMDRDKG